jgi:hypothetical protein
MAGSARGSGRSTNVRVTVKLGEPSGATTLRQARVADMDALEQLPTPVRFLLNELAIKLSAGSVLAYLRSIARQARDSGGSAYEAEVWTCRKLAAIESDDIDAFGESYRAQYRFPLPHIAAGATVQRYGPLDGRMGRDRRRRLLAT